MNFISFAASYGLIIEHAVHGKWVRCATVDHPRKKNGSYKLEGTIGWVQNGYDMPLNVGDVVLGAPGALTSSIGINSMIGKTVLIALFDLATASGSNATYRISGFARALLLGANLTGAAAGRSLTVRFETAVVDRPTASVGSGGNFGITTWAICAYDNKGVCS